MSKRDTLSPRLGHGQQPFVAGDESASNTDRPSSDLGHSGQRSHVVDAEQRRAGTHGIVSDEPEQVHCGFGAEPEVSHLETACSVCDGESNQEQNWTSDPMSDADATSETEGACNVVICCDGTWNEPAQMDRDRIAVTNVVHIARAASDGGEEHVVYVPGVGTGGAFDALWGGLTGAGLKDRVLEAYQRAQEQIRQLRKVGREPRLFLFGFSRGAYTARSLAGMLTKVGVELEAEEAFRAYKGRIEPEGVTPLDIHFLGVWNTVGALGIPLPISRRFIDILRLRYVFQDTKLSPRVQHAFQALAIDELRGPFRPCVWETSDATPNQVIEQVWFAGSHSNVGGGYVDNGLSGHAFRWMVGRARDLGLRVGEQYLDHPRAPAPEHRGELRDSFMGIYKQISWKFPRPIGSLDSGDSEAVHPSAIARYFDGTVPAYMPKGLQDLEVRVGVTLRDALGSDGPFGEPIKVSELRNLRAPRAPDPGGTPQPLPVNTPPMDAA